MASLSASVARTKLYRLIDDVTASHQPVLITGKHANAILISEEDWSAIQETLYLLSIPGMGKSIKDGLHTPIKKCAKEIKWKAGD